MRRYDSAHRGACVPALVRVARGMRRCYFWDTRGSPPPPRRRSPCSSRIRSLGDGHRRMARSPGGTAGRLAHGGEAGDARPLRRRPRAPRRERERRAPLRPRGEPRRDAPGEGRLRPVRARRGARRAERHALGPLEPRTGARRGAEAVAPPTTSSCRRPATTPSSCPRPRTSRRGAPSPRESTVSRCSATRRARPRPSSPGRSRARGAGVSVHGRASLAEDEVPRARFSRRGPPRRVRRGARDRPVLRRRNGVQCAVDVPRRFRRRRSSTSTPVRTSSGADAARRTSAIIDCYAGRRVCAYDGTTDVLATQQACAAELEAVIACGDGGAPP